MADWKSKLEGKALTLQWNVAPDDTFGGLLSTASLARFLLHTAWTLVDAELPKGVTSVAAMVQVTHEEPTPAGETVTVEARVTEVEGTVVRIAFKAVDETGVIAHGFNERHIVEERTLAEVARARAAALKAIT